MARLSPDNVQGAKALIALYPQPRSALIPILHVAQEQDGWLTPDGMAHIAELLDLAPAEVYGTASFYDMLFTHPVGKYLVSVCSNLACMLNGGDELLEHVADPPRGETGGHPPGRELPGAENQGTPPSGNPAPPPPPTRGFLRGAPPHT